MVIFNVVMLVINLILRTIGFVFRFAAGLHQQGKLIPVIIVSAGTFGAYSLWNGEGIIGKILAVLVGVITATVTVLLMARLHNKENPDKPLKWGMTLPFGNPRNNLPMHSAEPCGVVFGVQGKRWITKPETTDGHVLVVGGVGSGKSSCVAIPTLRNWKSSVFAIDIKGELRTHSNRKTVKVFNPLDSTAYGYDPFSCLNTNPAQESRAIAQAVVPLPPDTREPFWIESAQNILTACILHYSSQGLSFLDTMRKIQSMPVKSLIDELCENPETIYFVNSFSDMDERTLSSIMSELSKNIVPFVTDENLISALSRERNITPADLEWGNDVFIQIPEHLLKQWKTLLTLIANQFLTHFEQRAETTNTQPVLFLLDEFPRLGKVNAMLDGLATLRSKKITICLIVQSLAQLDMIYGQNERKVIADTCSYKAVLGATDADTQDYFSRLVGSYDKRTVSHGTSTSPFGLSGGTSTNTHDVEKRVIRPEEFGQLSDIVLITPHGMLRVDKKPYYAEK